MALGRGNIEIDVGARGFEDDIVSQVNSAQRRIQPLNLKLDDKGFRQPLGRISGDLSEFQNSLDASVARTLAFGAAVGVINSVASAFKGMLTSAVEVEKKLQDVNVILNLSSTQLVTFSSQLFEVAKNTGTSFETVSDAAVELARQGLGAEETLKRINDAMILTRLSGMDAAKSVSTLTAAINGFGSAALTTTEIINKLATVDAAFAVSTDDLANALSRAGATAQAVKVNMDELLGAVTSVQQATARGGAVIGNAFKSIFTRIQRSSVREQLESIGVATTDAAGNIRNAMSILKDYSQVYKSLSDGQRAYTDELVAGVFQINNLRALVTDLGSGFSVYEKAMKKSAGATDEATRRNAELDKTLSALINKSVANVKELAAALGAIVASPAVKNLLTIFNSISNALVKALDPEQGSSLIKGMFGAIGKFIAGPGLILIGAAFIKLFKFITGQSVKAISEVFKIKNATSKVADTEAKITHILQQNNALYKSITNETLNHEQREKLVLQVINQENAALLRQQSMISQLARSKVVQGATTSAAGGFIPNLANNVTGALASEKEAIRTGVGGASSSAKPKVLNGFPTGKGKKETLVANTDEMILPNYGGGAGSAIFNPDMISQLGGLPSDAKPVARGFVPNFARLQAPKEDAFYVPGVAKPSGATIKDRFYGMPQVSKAVEGAADSKGIDMSDTGIIKYSRLYVDTLKRKKDPFSQDILNVPDLFLKNKEGNIDPLTLRQVSRELSKPNYKFQKLSGPRPKLGKPSKESSFYASMFDGFIPNYIFANPEDDGLINRFSRQSESSIPFAQGRSVNLERKVSRYPKLQNRSKADPFDIFKGTIQAEFQGATRDQFNARARQVYGDGAIDKDWVKNISTGRIKADPSSVQKYTSGAGNIKAFKDFKTSGITQQQVLRDPKLKRKYSNLLRNRGTQFTTLADLKRSQVSGIQGIIGEIDAAKAANTTIEANNSFFDLADGREVKTVKQQQAGDILKKGINEYLASNNIKDGEEDTIPLKTRKVVLPSDAKLVGKGVASGFIPNFEDAEGKGDSVFWNRTIKKYRESGKMRPVSGIDIKGSAGLGAIIGSGSGGAISSSGRINSMSETIKGVLPQMLGDANLSSLGVIDPNTGQSPKGKIPLGDYLTAGRGTSIKGRFPSSPVYEAADSKEVSKEVGTNLFNSIAPSLKSTAANIYGKALPGQTQELSSQELDPERYLSKSTQGGLLEGAIRFGSDALEGNFGAADSENAAWDFTATGNIPKNTYDTFFKGTSVKIADAKRTKEAAQGSTKSSSMIQKTLRSMAGGASQPLFTSLRDSFSSDLFNKAKDLEGPSGELSRFATAESKSNKKLKGLKGSARKGVAASGGYIPNFANALEESIVREKKALSEQSSNAEIYLDQDKRLKGAQNPTGLLVANTRDEPLAGSQGVDRAVRGGMNPKNMGKAEGFIPNYIAGAGIQKTNFSSPPISSLIDGQQIKDELIYEFNLISGALSKESAELKPDINKMVSALGQLDKVGEKLEKEGIDLKNHISKGGLNKFSLGGVRDQVTAARQGQGGRGSMAADNRAGMFGGIGKQVDAIKGKFKGASGVLSKVGKGFSSMSGALGKASIALFYAETALTVLNGALAPLGISIPTTADAIEYLSDKLFNVDRDAINAANEHTKKTDKEIKTLAKSGEAIDKFSSDANKLNNSLKKGDTATSAKQFQTLMASIEGMKDIDPEKIKDVINSLGDDKKLSESLGDLKESLSDSTGVKNASKDFDALFTQLEEAGSRDWFGSTDNVDELLAASEEVFTGVAKKLTTSLSGSEIDDAAKAFEGINITAGNAYDELSKVPAVFDQLDAATKKQLSTNADIATGTVQAIQAQLQYQSSLANVEEQMRKLSRIPDPLGPVLNNLTKALNDAAVAGKAATDILFEQAKTNAEIAKISSASGPVFTEGEKAKGQSLVDKEVVNQGAANEIESLLSKFIAEIPKGQLDRNNNVTIDGTATGGKGNPVMEGILEGIKAGTYDSAQAVDALSELYKGGDEKQIKSIEDLKQAIRDENTKAIGELGKIDNNLSKQLAVLDAQRISLIKNQLTGVDSLKALYDVKNFTATGEKSSELFRRQQADLLNKQVAAMKSLGLDNTQGFKNLKAGAQEETMLANIASQFKAATGGEVQLEGDNIVAFNNQIQEFIRSGNLNELAERIGDGSLEMQSKIINMAQAIGETTQKLTNSEIKGTGAGGGAAEFAKAQLDALTIDQATLSDLSEAINAGMTDSIARLLGLSEEQQGALQGDANKREELAAQAENTNRGNIEVLDKNTVATTIQTDAMKNLAVILTSNTANLGESNAQLKAAADSLSIAAKQLERIKPATAGTAQTKDANASGLIPNFAKTGPVERAVRTEKKAGGRPVIDHHPSVGTYVRDGKSQPNFSAVKRDHPEGMSQAIKNSAASQEANALGLVPNFNPQPTEVAKNVANTTLGQYPKMARAIASQRTERLPEDQLKGDYLATFKDSIVKYYTGKNQEDATMVAASSGKFDNLTKKSLTQKVLKDLPPKDSGVGYANQVQQRSLTSLEQGKLSVESLIYGEGEGPPEKFVNFLNEEYSEWSDLGGLLGDGRSNFDEDTTDLPLWMDIALASINALGWISTAASVVGAVATAGAGTPAVVASIAAKQAAKKGLLSFFKDKAKKAAASRVVQGTSAALNKADILSKGVGGLAKGGKNLVGKGVNLGRGVKSRVSSKVGDVASRFGRDGKFYSNAPAGSLLGGDAKKKFLAEATAKTKGTKIYEQGLAYLGIKGGENTALATTAGLLSGGIGLAGPIARVSGGAIGAIYKKAATLPLATGLRSTSGLSASAVANAIESNQINEQNITNDSKALQSFYDKENIKKDAVSFTKTQLLDKNKSPEDNLLTQDPNIKSIIEKGKLKLSKEEGGEGTEDKDEDTLLPAGFGTNLNQLWSDGTMAEIMQSLGVNGSIPSEQELYNNAIENDKGQFDLTQLQSLAAANPQLDSLPLKLFRRKKSKGDTAIGNYDSRVPLQSLGIDNLFQKIGDSSAVNFINGIKNGGTANFFDGLQGQLMGADNPLLKVGGAGVVRDATFARELLSIQDGGALRFPEGVGTTVDDEGNLIMDQTPKSFTLEALKQSLSSSDVDLGKLNKKLKDDPDNVNLKTNQAIIQKQKEKTSAYISQFQEVMGTGPSKINEPSFISNARIPNQDDPYNAAASLLGGTGTPTIINAIKKSRKQSQTFNLGEGEGPQGSVQGLKGQFTENFQGTGGGIDEFIKKYFSNSLRAKVATLDPTGYKAASGRAVNNIQDLLNPEDPEKEGEVARGANIVIEDIDKGGEGGEGGVIAEQLQKAAIESENLKADREMVQAGRLRELRYAALTGLTESNVRGENNEERVNAQKVIDRAASDGSYNRYRAGLNRYQSGNEQSPYVRGLAKAKKLKDTGTNQSKISEEISHYEQALKVTDEAHGLYETGFNVNTLSDWLYQIKGAKGQYQFNHPRRKGILNTPRKSEPGGVAKLTALAQKLFLEIPGIDPYKNISKEAKEKLLKATGKEELNPNDYLKQDGYYEEKPENQKLQKFWAQIVPSGGNPDGSTFLNNFKGAPSAGREFLLQSIGATAKQITPETAGEGLGGASSEQLRFLLQSVPKADKESAKLLNTASLNMQGLNKKAFSEDVEDPITKTRLGFNRLGGVWDYLNEGSFKNLKQAVLSIKSNGQDYFPKAFPEGLLSGLKTSLYSVMQENAKDTDGKGADKYTKLIKRAAGNEDIDALRTNASFVNSTGLLEKVAKETLTDTNLVQNKELWKNYLTGGGEKGFNSYSKGKSLSLPDGQKGYGKINWQEANNELVGKPDVAPLDFLQGTYGNVLYHGLNQGIENLLNSTDSHFYKDELGIEVDGGLKEKIQNAIKANDTNEAGGMNTYAPFGYRAGFGRPKPAGSRNENNYKILTRPLEKVKPAPENDPVPEIVANAGGAGLVPNFSAIAGEISASREAGYAKGVSPSQVKTMNIPGRGKTSYNTQETIFKGAGMQQPFIVPPSNSKAAKPYANKVQKKFGFNPYNKAADGLVPNFAPTSVEAFMTSLSDFAGSLGTSTEALTAVATTMESASQNLAGIDSSSESINIEPLTAASSNISSSVQSLSSVLAEGVGLNDSVIVQSMNALATSLGNLSVDVTVDVPDVNVSVNGGGAIQEQIKTAFNTNLRSVITEELSNLKSTLKEEITRNITGI